MAAPDSEKHWQSVYASRATDAVSWYQKRPDLSLDLIAASGIARDAAIIDVGGGASVLVDHLLENGYGDVSVLDIADSALCSTRERLGQKAESVTWVATDIRIWTPDRTYALWHDRAVFHFLTERADRESYVATLKRALAPGGHVIIATFSLEGPEKCSGLPVVRYDAASLTTELGEDFALIEERYEEHVTPSGATQKFLWCRFNRAGA